MILPMFAGLDALSLWFGIVDVLVILALWAVYFVRGGTIP